MHGLQQSCNWGRREWTCGCVPVQDTELDRQERKLGMQEAASRQRWRWLLVAFIGVIVACLSMLLNLCITWLNLARINATERVISGTGFCSAAVMHIEARTRVASRMSFAT